MNKKNMMLTETYILYKQYVLPTIPYLKPLVPEYFELIMVQSSESFIIHFPYFFPNPQWVLRCYPRCAKKHKIFTLNVIIKTTNRPISFEARFSHQVSLHQTQGSIFHFLSFLDFRIVRFFVSFFKKAQENTYQNVNGYYENKQHLNLAIMQNLPLSQLPQILLIETCYEATRETIHKLSMYQRCL